MYRSIIEEVKSAVKNWWLFLIIGILFVGLSVLLMIYPVESYGAFVIVFSACMFLSGFFEIVFSITNRKILPGWGWYLACGIIELLMGFYLMFDPITTALTIPFILAFWMLFKGFTAVGISADLNRMGSSGWGWSLVFGILAIICSLAIIWNPEAGVIASVYILAFVFMFMGLFRIMLSFELRNLYKNSQKLKERLEAIRDVNE